jgi:hypothetical protein
MEEPVVGFPDLGARLLATAVGDRRVAGVGQQFARSRECVGTVADFGEDPRADAGGEVLGFREESLYG